MAQTSIFISHSHQDDEWCRAFAAALTAIGYGVWYDEEVLQGGDAWVAKIQQEVQSRDVFLIVLTPEAWESQWVQDELQLAIATRRRIVPVLLRNTQVSGFLLTTQWITVIGEEPQVAARAAVLTIEAPPAPGRNAAPQATTETLDDLIMLCRSLAAEKRYTEALSACNRALALDTKSVDVLTIKAQVLHAIGENRLEGRTLYELLLADPNISYPRDPERLEAMFSSLSEEEVLQAYSLLRSAAFYNSQLAGTAEVQVLRALQRHNQLDTASDVLEQVRGSLPRMTIADHLRMMQRPDLAIRLLETWYGYPPRGASLDDIPSLAVYASALVDVGRADEVRTLDECIVRAFEFGYGFKALRMLPAGRLPHRYYENRNAPEGIIYKFKLYLGALVSIGRTEDAENLREQYLRTWFPDRR